MLSLFNNHRWGTLSIVLVKQQTKLPLSFDKPQIPKAPQEKAKDFTPHMKEFKRRYNEILSKPRTIEEFDNDQIKTELEGLKQHYDAMGDTWYNSPFDDDTYFPYTDKGYQSTLPQHMLGLYTENYMDPETGKIREGAIPPVNALKIMDRKDIPKIMSHQGLIPNVSRDNYQYEDSTTMPFGGDRDYDPETGYSSGTITGNYVTGANVIDLGRAVEGTKRQGESGVIAIRGISPADKLQIRPPDGNVGELVSEAIIQNRIPPERIVPVKHPKTHELLDNDDISFLRNRANFSRFIPYQELPIPFMPEQFAGMYDEDGFPMIGGKKLDKNTKNKLIDENLYDPKTQFNARYNEIYGATTPPSWGSVLENMQNLTPDELNNIRHLLGNQQEGEF